MKEIEKEKGGTKITEKEGFLIWIFFSLNQKERRR
jgi:hypothetical protein